MTPTNPTEAQMELAREALAQAATELAPPSSSMRMNDFTDKAAQISARAIVLAIQATEARAQGLVDALEDSKRAVQAFLDMVNVMQRVQALPIPVFLETAQHNCPIILQNLDQALATWRRT